jgi:hypothetical protein
MRTRRVGIALLLMGMVAAAGFTQTTKSSGNPLIGTWKIVETTPVNGVKITNPQPSLYIFTPKHYSIMAVTGTKPRPTYTQGNATPEQKIEMFDAFVANSGTYSVVGNLLKLRPVVAKQQFVMAGPDQELELKIEGNTISLIANNGPGQGSVNKLMRVE